ncbi:hypothetical protein [Clostridium sp.]|uniref:hypothetical protein n=1 Tax=Clostridium sp. TaxID=1506 RepID=UPI0025BB96A3|nr:hypothetical protein [Clostridium sp.]
MEKFSLKEHIKNPSKKIVTRDGKPVKIIYVNKLGTYPIVALVKISENCEKALTFTEDGDNIIGGNTNRDLFFDSEKETSIKTFEDLDINVGLDGRMWAKEFFNNGYGISIIRNFVSYTSTDILNFEIAVLKGTKEQFSICYDTGITDDVIGYCTPKKITKIMEQIQNLK